MRSIRFALILYFLGLLAVGLGAVAGLADWVSGAALGESEAAARDAIDLRLGNRVQDERRRFDDELLKDARRVARDVLPQYGTQLAIHNRRMNTAVFGSLFALAPSQPLTAAAYTAALPTPPRRGQPPVPWPSFYVELMRVYSGNLRLDDSLLRHPDDDHAPEYVQLDGASGGLWRSDKMQAAGYRFPLDRPRLDAALDDSRYDTVRLPGGMTGRRVVYRVPLGFQSFPRGGPPRDGRRPGGEPRADDPVRPPGPPPDVVFPRMYVQVAEPVAPLDDRVAELTDEADRQKLELAVGTARTRRRVRFALVATGLAAFAALLVGGLPLIRRGLAPLARLSDAVGQVSERDFRLPVSAVGLPRELVPIHARLTETLDQLRAAFDREKQAVADISHELRTPVASLLTTLDVSLRKPRTADQYRETMVECRAITKQLGQLVERVMTLAYLDAGQTKLAALRVEADMLAAEAAAVVKPLAVAHGLTFRVEAAEGVELDTDPDKLREVLTNLLHNAVEYNRPGGEVLLTVTAKGGRAVFAVRDTGIGMTPEVAGRVFERFFRADPSRTQTGVHAGLGLAIVKEYVDRLGGTIRVDSEPGVGSTFTVELPGAEVREPVGV